MTGFNKKYKCEPLYEVADKTAHLLTYRSYVLYDDSKPVMGNRQQQSKMEASS